MGYKRCDSLKLMCRNVTNIYHNLIQLSKNEILAPNLPWFHAKQCLTEKRGMKRCELFNYRVKCVACWANLFTQESQTRDFTRNVLLGLRSKK